VNILRTEILNRAYEAFNRRDVDSVLALMTRDVDWPNASEGTRITGHDQVRSYWSDQWAVLNPRVNPVAIEELDPDRSVVHVHQVVRDLSENILVDQFVDHVYTFSGDLISRMDICPATHAPDTSV
jgi:hypothetical protein